MRMLCREQAVSVQEQRAPSTAPVTATGTQTLCISSRSPWFGLGNWEDSVISKITRTMSKTRVGAEARQHHALGLSLKASCLVQCPVFVGWWIYMHANLIPDLNKTKIFVMLKSPDAISPLSRCWVYPRAAMVPLLRGHTQLGCCIQTRIKPGSSLFMLLESETGFCSSSSNASDCVHQSE